jgi:KDO2-lipid IV(A) lauroyltransferase
MKIVNFLAYAILKSFLLMGRVVPMGITYWWLSKLARIAYRLARGRRALMLYNLEMALDGETTAKEREEIARKSFESLFISLGELFHMDQMYASWRKHFTYEGDEILDRLIKEGRGFFVFGGHFGAWLSMASVVYRFPDLPGVNIVARPMRNPRVQELMEYLASKFGGEIITTRGTGEVMVERIKKGHLIGLYMDQESRRDQGIFVNFFGREACSHVVPGYLAWKHDIPLVPYWLLRKKPGYVHCIFREPLKYELTDDADENNRIVAQLIADEIERTIREYPAQWLWGHNRWRRRPDGTKIPIFEKQKKRSRTGMRKKGDYVSSEDLAKKSGDS